MIESVTFKNFEALRDATVPLSPLTLIVGPNASGKTTILEGLECLARLAKAKPEEVFEGTRDMGSLRSWNATEPVRLGLEGIFGKSSIRFSLEGKTNGADAWTFRTRSARSVDGGAKWQELGVGWGRLLGPSFQSAGAGALLLHLDPVQLAKPSYSVDKVPRVGADGSNLPSVLADWAITDPSGFQALQKRIQEVVPSFKALGFNRESIVREEYWQDEGDSSFQRQRTKYVGYGLKLDFNGSEGLPAHAASEGTLITLALLTVLARPPVPRLVLIDEMERGLHPKALGELVRQVRALMKSFPGTQVIATTHSPYLVDNFRPEEIVLTTLSEDGSAVVGALNEHPDFERWKDEMKPGEFWSTVGEDWLREEGNQVVNAGDRLLIAVVCEASADQRTACTLADRVACEKIDWLDADHLDSLRRWCGVEPNAAFLAWKLVPAEADRVRVVAHGHFGGEPGAPDAKAARRAILVVQKALPRVGAIILMRDSDADDSRRKGLEQARAAAARPFPIIIALAHAKRECWLIAAHCPRTAEEMSLHDNVRQELGFDPCANSHLLDARTPRSKKEAKRVWAALCPDDDQSCLTQTAMEVLRERGQQNGLAAYLGELEERLVPLFGRQTPRA